jgi:ParB/RepB/Spo0J family partition protein
MELTPLAVSAAPILFAIDNARAVAWLSDKGPQLVEANAVRAIPDGHVAVTHAQIIRDKANAREDFNEDDLAEFADGIFERGILQKPLLRPTDDPNLFRLGMGERRWRAWGLLIADGRWPADHVEICPVRAVDDLTHTEDGLVENLNRTDLNHMEIAAGFERLATLHGRTNEQIAAATKRSVRYVQQHRQLMGLDGADQGRLRMGHISLHEALKILSQPKAEPIEVTDAQRLILLEVLHHQASQGKAAYYSACPCDWRHAGDVEDDLAERHWLDFGTGWNTGAATVKAGYRASQAKVDHYNLALKDIEPALEAVRQTLGVSPPEGRYHTAWLNPPFECDPAMLQAVADRAAEQAADKKRRAEAQAVSKATKDKAHAVGQALKKVVVQPLSPELIDIVEGFGIALPVRRKGSEIVDARGKRVASTTYHQSIPDAEGGLIALAIALNAACGFAATALMEGEADLQTDLEDDVTDPADAGEDDEAED